MGKLKMIDRAFEHGYITADEWERQREAYEEILLKMYLEGKITEEELLEKLDK